MDGFETMSFVDTYLGLRSKYVPEMKKNGERRDLLLYEDDF